MTGPIVQSSRGVTLLGGGELLPGDLDEALSLAPTLVAADGGADLALAAGRMPAAVIGDFDSISDKARAELPPALLHHVTEQDSTDFEKALRAVEAPFVLGLGFMGARVDHTLAAFTTLVTHEARCCILVGPQDVCFLSPLDLSLDLPPDTRLSLFPMGPVMGESEGLRWPIAGLRFAPDGRIGTSNQVTGPVRLRFDCRRMLAILPRLGLLPTLRALVGPHAPVSPGE